MSVVNCKVKFIRPRYHNLMDWMEDANNRYIGRAGVVFIDRKRFPRQSSPFANPYRVGKNGTRDEVVEKYRKYISERLREDVGLQRELVDLKGKNLGCWCHPDPCHGDVLLELIKEYDKPKEVSMDKPVSMEQLEDNSIDKLNDNSKDKLNDNSIDKLKVSSKDKRKDESINKPAKSPPKKKRKINRS